MTTKDTPESKSNLLTTAEDKAMIARLENALNGAATPDALRGFMNAVTDFVVSVGGNLSTEYQDRSFSKGLTGRWFRFRSISEPGAAINVYISFTLGDHRPD